MRRLLWGDFETTTFDPAEGLMLEAAFLVTDESLREEAAVSVVVRRTSEELADESIWHPAARKFHEANGLIRESLEASMNLKAADSFLASWIQRHAPGESVDPEDRLIGLWLAGSGLDFERRWLPTTLPSCHALINRRNFDVNTLIAFHGADDLMSLKDESVKAHRALQDVRRDVGIAREIARRAGVLQ